MDTYYFNDELECRFCGYRFFVSVDHEIQFPTFCPECGEIEVFRASWPTGERQTSGQADTAGLRENFQNGLLSFE